MACNKATQHENGDLDEEDEIPEEVVKEVENFENKPKSNLDKIEAVNLGDAETVKETRINIHFSPTNKEEYIRFLKEYEDIFAWSYDDMTGLSTSIVAHKLPTNPMCPLVKQKLRKFKLDMSLKIKEEVTKQIKAKFLPEKLLGFIVSRRGIELDPSKFKAIHELPPPRSKKDMMSFLGCLNYISRFIAQSTIICKPIFKILRKDAETSWTEDGQKALDKIKEYLSTPLVLVLSEPGQPLLLYISKVVKGQALADHLAENLIGGEYEPLKTYFPDKEVLFVGEDITEAYDSWGMFFDGAANFKGVGIGAVLVSETGQHYLISAKLRFSYTKNMAKYEACILGLNMAVNMNIQELLPAYCAHVEEETDGKPWFHDIKDYLAKGEYLEHANHTQKRTLRRLSNHFFHSGGNLYRRTPDLGLIRCVAAKKASKLLEDVHAGTCDSHINGFVLAKKILRASYFWMTMENDCIQYVCKCFQCQDASYKAVTKKVIANFVKDHIVCRFGVPESIVNATNRNSDLMKAMCETFKIKHKNSTAYKP
ncbi:uncharacterized protein [Nicotiana sylvestris]|uniref:uncharacterized protein n=1 Tax=Nicotiana sylvestris TaxID=4096 RepID=UPI00388C42B1